MPGRVTRATAARRMCPQTARPCRCWPGSALHPAHLVGGRMPWSGGARLTALRCRCNHPRSPQGCARPHQGPQGTRHGRHGRTAVELRCAAAHSDHPRPGACKWLPPPGRALQHARWPLSFCGQAMMAWASPMRGSAQKTHAQQGWVRLLGCPQAPEGDREAVGAGASSAHRSLPVLDGAAHTSYQNSIKPTRLLAAPPDSSPSEPTRPRRTHRGCARTTHGMDSSANTSAAPQMCSAGCGFFRCAAFSPGMEGRPGGHASAVPCHACT